MWTWPTDDSRRVNIDEFTLRPYPKAKNSRIDAAYRPGDHHRDSAPAYLIKYGGQAVAERLYYRLARVFGLPQQWVFWANDGEVVDQWCRTIPTLRRLASLPLADRHLYSPIPLSCQAAVAIQFELDARFAAALNEDRSTVVCDDGQRATPANALDSIRHNALHIFCGSGDSSQTMLRQDTLFGIDAANCLTQHRAASYWLGMLSEKARSRPIYPTFREMLKTIVQCATLAETASQELAEAPFPEVQQLAGPIGGIVRYNQEELAKALEELPSL